MISLRCNVSKCINNNSKVCNAENVNIVGGDSHTSKDTCCCTFRENSFKNSLSNLSSLNYFGELKQIFNSSASTQVETRIYCDVKSCYHNSLGSCTAQNINVVQSFNNDRSGICCETFIEAY